MLVTSIFSFSHDIFKGLLSKRRQQLGLLDKEFRMNGVTTLLTSGCFNSEANGDKVNFKKSYVAMYQVNSAKNEDIMVS